MHVKIGVNANEVMAYVEKLERELGVSQEVEAYLRTQIEELKSKLYDLEHKEDK